MHLDIKVHNNKIVFNILELDKDSSNLIYRNEIILPICYSISEKLVYIRNLIEIFIKKYSIESSKVDIYVKHRNVENKYIDREIRNVIEIEGVLEELFLSKGVKIWR